MIRQAAPGFVVALTDASEPGDTEDVMLVIVVAAAGAGGGAVGCGASVVAAKVGRGVGAGVGVGVGEGFAVAVGVGRGVGVACAVARGVDSDALPFDEVGLPDDPPLDDAATITHATPTAPVTDQRMRLPV